jgi:hypothetical protein
MFFAESCDEGPLSTNQADSQESRGDFMVRIYIVTACILLGAVAAQAAQTGKVIVGVNTVGVAPQEITD